MKRRKPPPKKTTVMKRLRPSNGNGTSYHKHTKYRPHFCNKVIDLMAEGASKKELAIELGVSPWSVSDWEKRHPEFHQAIRIGEMLSEAWWMREGRRNIHNKEFNAVLFMMNMANRFGWTRRWDVNAKTEHHETKTLEIKFDMKKLSSNTIVELLSAMGQNLLPDWSESQQVIDVTPETSA